MSGGEEVFGRTVRLAAQEFLEAQGERLGVQFVTEVVDGALCWVKFAHDPETDLLFIIECGTIEEGE